MTKRDETERPRMGFARSQARRSCCATHRADGVELVQNEVDQPWNEPRRRLRLLSHLFFQQHLLRHDDFTTLVRPAA
jgi:hypothetical protein